MEPTRLVGFIAVFMRSGTLRKMWFVDEEQAAKNWVRETQDMGIACELFELRTGGQVDVHA